MKSIEALGSALGAPTVALVGIGNPDRADDSFGLLVAHALQQHFPERVFTEHEGMEKVMRTIKERPDIDKVLFLDTVDAHLHAGQLILLEEDEIEEHPLSSHHIPLKLYGALSGKPYFILGIQPLHCSYRGEVSPEVRRGIRRAISILSSFLAQ